MGEETEEEFADDMGDEFEGDVGEDLDDDDIDLGDIDDDEEVDFEADEDDAGPPRRGGSAKDDDLLPSNYEQAVKANPKRAQKHQKRARIIEGVLDTAELGTDEGMAKAWNALQSQAPDAKPRKYSMKEEYSENDVIDHPTFGEGYVVEILSSAKISVLFEDGMKKLAQNK